MSHILNVFLPQEIEKKVAINCKNMRLQNGYKQQTLADKSGVSLGSIKRFEATGKISLSGLIKIANTLDCMTGFLSLFPKVSATTIKQLEILENRKIKKRGTL